MSRKINGIRSVDFKIYASGHGAVNWNGVHEFKYMDKGDWKTAKNTSVPKVMNFGAISKNNPADVHFSATSSVFISQNCIRHNAFKREMPRHLPKLTNRHAEDFLCSSAGFVRGYAIADGSPIFRKSPLNVENFIEQKHNTAYNVHTSAMNNKTADTGNLFGKINLGDTEYVGYASLNIEDLQFVVCDAIFGRAAVDVGQDVYSLTTKINDMLIEVRDDLAALQHLEELTPGGIASLNPIATYADCYVRNGSMMKVGEAGILLNEDAIHLLVLDTFDRLLEIEIRQGNNGYMKVDKVEIDFNDEKMMRIKSHGSDMCSTTKMSNYAIYYHVATPEEVVATKNAEKLIGETPSKKLKETNGLISKAEKKIAGHKDTITKNENPKKVEKARQELEKLEKELEKLNLAKSELENDVDNETTVLSGVRKMAEGTPGVSDSLVD